MTSLMRRTSAGRSGSLLALGLPDTKLDRRPQLAARRWRYEVFDGLHAPRHQPQQHGVDHAHACGPTKVHRACISFWFTNISTGKDEPCFRPSRVNTFRDGIMINVS